MKREDFIVGEWYACSCNDNYFRFNGFLENNKFGSDAVINRWDYIHGSAKPGYTERISHNACIEYFNPNKLADMNIVNKFLPKKTSDKTISYEIY